MSTAQLVRDRVHTAYWDHDWHCAMTTLHVLAEVFGFDLHQQVLDAAVGMYGAGGYRAQCGLVEGGLMAIGILGRAQGLAEETVGDVCYAYAESFEGHFDSLLCRELRPGGFQPDDPPHLCEDLTREAILFDVDFIARAVYKEEGLARNGALTPQP